MPHLPGSSHKRKGSLTSSRPSSMDETRRGGDDVTKEDETVMDEDQGNMLSHIISQLRPGADLSRVTLPTFILEPRSMLERITNFMAHPETMLPITEVQDPIHRFVAVTKFYLSGWHIKPPGVKKPLNPILGEIFTGYWNYPDGTKGYYIAEQTSHHPPKSSYFFMAPEHNIRIDGCLKPRSKFLGNSAASMMEGIAVLRLLNSGERYFVTQPNMYARGILFGTMKYELGDHAYIRCPETGLVADLEFKTRGYFSGTYNAIGGFIKDSHDKNLFELSGLWNEEMYIKDLTTGKKELLFDASHAKHSPPLARPLEEQDERESQKLWHDVTEAVKRRDQNVATDAKAKVEDMQREEAAKRNSEGVEWRPRLFTPIKAGLNGAGPGEDDLEWIIGAKVDAKTPDEIIQQILQIHAILPGQKPGQETQQEKKHETSLPIRTNTQQTVQPPSQQSTSQPPPPQQPTPQQPASQPVIPQQYLPQQFIPQQSAHQQTTPQQSTARQLVPPQPAQAGSGTFLQYSQQGFGNMDGVPHSGSAAPEPSRSVQGGGSIDSVDHSGSAVHQASHSLSKSPFASDPSNPAVVPQGKPTTDPGTLSDSVKVRIAQELPPSKLLNSNPEPEPRRPDVLRRKDSETQQDEEFVDALT